MENQVKQNQQTIKQKQTDQAMGRIMVISKSLRIAIVVILLFVSYMIFDNICTMRTNKFDIFTDIYRIKDIVQNRKHIEDISLGYLFQYEQYSGYTCRYYPDIELNDIRIDNTGRIYMRYYCFNQKILDSVFSYHQNQISSIFNLNFSDYVSGIEGNINKYILVDNVEIDLRLTNKYKFDSITLPFVELAIDIK